METENFTDNFQAGGPLIEGFSKLSKASKIDFLSEYYLSAGEEQRRAIEDGWHRGQRTQEIFDQFSENTIGNFHIPYGVVPNVKIGDQLYCVPVVTEESSVVAAASKASKFWFDRGGIKTRVEGVEKIGQVHFIWRGAREELFTHFAAVKEELVDSLSPLLRGMRERGGGLKDLRLRDLTDKMPDYYQLWATFDTCDAMGANHINSVLERLSLEFANSLEAIPAGPGNYHFIMAILSNYTPNCRVVAEVQCSLDDFPSLEDLTGGESLSIGERIALALEVANVDVNRAVTHNKGIMNGIDAVILATGNDFRAVEACAHAYAARSGEYRSLSSCHISGGRFHFSLEVPLALGTIGGLTALHPMVKVSLDMLGSPSAPRLMEIAAAVGLMQNFSALYSLVTSGIQRGHMKMHLMNILNHLGADEREQDLCRQHFANKRISFNAVREFVSTIRNYH